MDDVLAVVTGLIEQVTDVPAEEIGPNSGFAALTNWTSFAALRLLTLVEDAYGVRLDLRAYFAAPDPEALVALVLNAIDERASEAS